MVHEQVYPLLALGLEGLEKAKMLFVYRLVAHCVALGFAITVAVALHFDQTPLEIIAAIATIASEFGALCLHHWALELHSQGRQVMRRVLLLDALNPGEAPAIIAKAQAHFGKALNRKAEAFAERDRKEPDPSKRRLPHYY